MINATNRLLHVVLGVTLLSAYMTASAGADVIVFDQFNDGDINNDGISDGAASTGSDAKDIPWLMGNTSNATMVSTSVSGDNALRFTTANGGITRLYIGTLYSETGKTSRAGASSVSLGVGQSLKLSFNVSFGSGIYDNTSTVFRFGLYSSNGTLATDNGTTNSDDDSGYFVNVGTGTKGSSLLVYKEVGNSYGILGGSDLTSLSGNGGFAVSNTGGDYSFTFGIERTDDKTLVFTVFQGNTLLLTTTNSSGIYTNFDEIAISALTGSAHNLDNVKLEFVPEPSAIGLLAISSVAFLYARKR